MASLNQIGARIANAHGQPFNHELKERAKDAFRSKAAERLRQTFEKTGIDDELVMTYKATLKAIKDFNPCGIDVNCGLYITENKVPSLIRFKGDNPFTFIGLKDGSQLIYIKRWEEPLMKHMPVIDRVPYVYFINRYLITNSKKDSIIISAPFSNPAEVLNYCSSTECYTDDVDFPVGEDMIESIIQELLSTSFKTAIPTDITADIK